MSCFQNAKIKCWCNSYCSPVIFWLDKYLGCNRNWVAFPKLYLLFGTLHNWRSLCAVCKKPNVYVEKLCSVASICFGNEFKEMSFHATDQKTFCTRGVQIPSARSPWWLKCWRLTFVDTQYGTCFISSFWRLEFLGGF
jgi:hypothetical protein